MKRYLVFGMTENAGGVESVLMNYYRHINRDRIQFDFLCNTFSPVAYEDEIQALGGRIYRVTPRRQNRIRFMKELDALLREHAGDWAGIWVNVSSLANIDYLKTAKKYGIPRRIIHSHNSENMDGFLRGILHYRNKGRVVKYATDLWACSAKAGEWFYGKNPDTVLIRNAIEVGRVSFDENKRREKRQAYGLEGRFVIGHVGRLHFQKNQEFLISVYERYHRTDPESRLVLIGQGEDEQKLKEQVQRAGLHDAVLFAGMQQDVQGWLSAFDLFLFPSLFEGLSIAVLEAQANGLPVIASGTAVEKDARITDSLTILDLEQGTGAWAEEIAGQKNAGREEPQRVREQFETHGFDIVKEAARLEERLLA